MKTYFTVHAVVMNEKKEILILQRAGGRTSSGEWNHVTGYAQDRESAEEATLRELKEETNLTGTIVKTTQPFWVDDGSIRWVIVASLIKAANISDLQIDPNESQDYKWIQPNDTIVKTSQGLMMSLKNLQII